MVNKISLINFNRKKVYRDLAFILCKENHKIISNKIYILKLKLDPAEY